MKPLFAKVALLVVMACTVATVGAAVPFVSSYTDGETWNSIYAQGFSPLVNATPDPMLDFTEPVQLDRFQFFKSGNEDVDVPLRLAIVNNFFVNLDELTIENEALVGLSTNTINGTASIPVGAPITFNFDNLELDYSLFDFAAIYVTEVDGLFTPVLVPSMIADYVETEPGSEEFAPESDYGDPELEYQYATSNFINSDEFGSFLAAFNAPHADASFAAYFDLETLEGDYNNDGEVDAADFTAWRDNLTQSIALPNETVTPGVVTQEDYDAWAGNFGATANVPYPTAPPVAGTAVPEPASLALGVLAGGMFVARRRGDR